MEHLAGNEKFINLLTGWKPKSLQEKKLVLGIIHRKNHKDVIVDEKLDAISGQEE